MAQPEFKASLDTTLIAQRLVCLEVGQQITYEQIAELCGRPIKRVRASAASAIRIVQRDHKMVFSTVRTVGYVRLNDSEIVDTYDQTRMHIRRQSARAAKRIVCVDYATLSKEKQVKHNAALSMLGAITEMASAGSVKRIEQAIVDCGTSLPSAKAAIAALGI